MLRSLVLISTIMAIFFYSVYIGEVGGSASALKLDRHSELGALETALQTAGGRLVTVVVTGWTEVAGFGDLDRAERFLGWHESSLGEMQRGNLRIVPNHGRLYLTLTWTLKGADLKNWEEHYQTARSAMRAGGRDVHMAVQLEGEREVSDPVQVTEGVSGALRGLSPQRWQDARASSIAGQSPLLPPRDMGVNYQVAARRLETGVIKIWVGWPVLNQEY